MATKKPSLTLELLTLDLIQVDHLFQGRSLIAGLLLNMLPFQVLHQDFLHSNLIFLNLNRSNLHTPIQIRLKDYSNLLDHSEANLKISLTKFKKSRMILIKNSQD